MSELLELKPIRISHSQKRSFLKCPRQWELRYTQGLSPKSVSDKKPMLLGSAVHAGIAAALTHVYEKGILGIGEALKACSLWIITNTTENKMRWIAEGGYEIDNEYYRMMREVEEEAHKLLRFYLPRMELGTRYVPIGTHELMMDTEGKDEPCVELKFEYPLTEVGDKWGKVDFSGYIDAVMKDITTGEIVIFDFKVRGMFGYDQIAALDDQLFIYAALLERVGVKIDKICMYQIRSKLPSPASISKVSGLPNLGGENGFDTTRDYWLETLPANVKPDQWLPKVEHKFKSLSDWIRPIYMPVTTDANNLTVLNLVATARMMLEAIEQDSFPAVLDSNVCKQCDFWKLCSALQYGGNPAAIIEQSYDRKAGYEEVD